MEHCIGFIGGGNMGRAIMSCLLKAELYQPHQVMVYDAYTPVMEKLEESLHIKSTMDVTKLVKEAEIIVLAVKPQVLPDVLAELKDKIDKNKLIISIAAGISIAQLEEMISPEHHIVRVMSNTPALVGAAMTGVCLNKNVDEKEKKAVLSIFKALGRAELITENLMDAVVGISGSSPAYVYMFINALADGAVLEGMSKNQAYIFAAQAVLGSAKMDLESGYHPGELIDMVCSPGGTTIQAVQVLEHNAFRSTIIEAVRAAATKNHDLGDQAENK